MEKSVRRGSLLPLIICFLILGLCLSCASTPIVTHTPEEVLIAQQAVIKVMNIIATAGAESFETQWKALAANSMPDDSVAILANIDVIPGLRMQLDNYFQAIQRDVASIANQIPTFLTQEIFLNLSIADPFSLIKGNKDSLTRYFASQVSSDLEAWITLQLSAEELSGMKAWKELVRSYNMYTQSRNLLHPDSTKPLITSNPVHILTVTMLRQLLEVMKTQEALLRSMAPAYEDPLIALFGSL